MPQAGLSSIPFLLTSSTSATPPETDFSEQIICVFINWKANNILMKLKWAPHWSPRGSHSGGIHGVLPCFLNQSFYRGKVEADIVKGEETDDTSLLPSSALLPIKETGGCACDRLVVGPPYAQTHESLLMYQRVTFMWVLMGYRPLSSWLSSQSY